MCYLAQIYKHRTTLLDNEAKGRHMDEREKGEQLLVLTNFSGFHTRSCRRKQMGILTKYYCFTCNLH